jgi:hypothetical protein
MRVTMGIVSLAPDRPSRIARFRQWQTVAAIMREALRFSYDRGPED